MFLHITNSHVATIKYHNVMHYPIFMACTCSCNLFDVISIYSLNMGKLPGRFSYKRSGYEASQVRTLNCVMYRNTVINGVQQTPALQLLELDS